MNELKENEIFESLQQEKTVCRFCFSHIAEGIKCHSIFEKNIYQNLKVYLSSKIKLLKDDFLPQSLCSKCYKQLKNTYRFLCILFESQNVISKYIEQRHVSDDEIDFLECDDSNEMQFRNTCNVKQGINKCKKEAESKVKEDAISRNSKRKKQKKIAKNGTLKKFICSNCDKKYVSQFELEVHLRKHTGEKPFSCSFCKKCFTDKRNLKKHEKIHTGDKTYECSTCHKTFLHLFSLKTHERLHTSERPYVCENCGKSVNTATELKIHFRIHSKERPYCCIICDKTFSSKAALNIHAIVHTGEKKYVCTVCSRKCRTSYDLKTHMRCHSNEKPYACMYANCDKKYKNSSQLNVHLRTHRGEKSHQCLVCHKQFGESNTLKRHMKIHEKNIEDGSNILS